jgi:hypothetical protein
MTKTYRTLPADYTQEEKLQLAAKLSAMNIRIELLMNEKAALPKKIAALQSEAAELAKDFTSGKINREVECTWELDEPDPGTKSLKRTDTGEVIETEPMTLFDIEQGETVFKGKYA